MTAFVQCHHLVSNTSDPLSLLMDFLSFMKLDVSSDDGMPQNPLTSWELNVFCTKSDACNLIYANFDHLQKLTKSLKKNVMLIP